MGLSMSNSTDIFGGASGKPKRITKITIGTGTYIPLEDGSRCRILRQASGGGGAAKSGLSTWCAGGAGAMVESFELVPIAGITYSVGAAGTAGINAGAAAGKGNPTSCGSLIAPPGDAGQAINGAVKANGGALINGDVTNGIFGLLQGVSGGAAGSSNTSKGYAPGFPIAGTTGNGSVVGGGDSYFGQGGVNGTTGGAPTGYGAGGGAGSTGNGSAGGGGYIEIWDFGA